MSISDVTSAYLASLLRRPYVCRLRRNAPFMILCWAWWILPGVGVERLQRQIFRPGVHTHCRSSASEHILALAGDQLALKEWRWAYKRALYPPPAAAGRLPLFGRH